VSEPTDLADALVSSFYVGLGADRDSVTIAIRRRDVAIARQLVAAGATPTEAEAYARETSTAPGRLAPVDLRSFERERLGWLARRRGTNQAKRQVIDRTGQPPSWQATTADSSPPTEPVISRQSPQRQASTPHNEPDLAGDGFLNALGALLPGRSE
jgi:hypothetical protein